MKNQQGFTLIELMIVAVIITILSAVAYPSYMDSVRKSNRADAITTMLDAAQQLERCMTAYASYNNANCKVTAPAGTNHYDQGDSFISPKAYYSITFTELSASAYKLTADPVAGSPQANDTNCTSFVLTDKGVKSFTPTTSVRPCW